jgi:uncharacterized protein YegP (UPF0339 family)
MASWFTLDKDGYRARLWSGSDLIWWTEGYERKADALNAIRIAKASHNYPCMTARRRPPNRRGAGVPGRPGPPSL